MDHYLRWAGKKHSLRRRLAATLPAGLLFVGLIPLTLAWLGPRADRALGLPPFPHGPAVLPAAALLVAAGGFFALWTVYVQFARAEGTPLPMMPTQRLLTDGPFAWCRNPMTFGTVSVYLGLSLAVGAWSALALVALGAALLLSYIRRVEEAELGLRFGADYLQYRERTPFFLPRPPRRG